MNEEINEKLNYILLSYFIVLAGGMLVVQLFGLTSHLQGLIVGVVAVFLAPKVEIELEKFIQGDKD